MFSTKCAMLNSNKVFQLNVDPNIFTSVRVRTDGQKNQLRKHFLSKSESVNNKMFLHSTQR